MSKKKGVYQPPQVTKLTFEDEAKEKDTLEQPEQPKVKKEVNRPNDQAIGVSVMKQSDSPEVIEIITNRIKKHMSYLNGSVGFAKPEDRIDEQITFIETIGNSLKLPYHDFVAVTNVLITEIRNNQEVFDKGLAFRFTMGLDKKYPLRIISTYQTYMTFMSLIACNWSSRHRLDKLVDMTYGIQALDRVGKENVTRYFKQLIAR